MQSYRLFSWTREFQILKNFFIFSQKNRTSFKIVINCSPGVLKTHFWHIKLLIWRQVREVVRRWPSAVCAVGGAAGDTWLARASGGSAVQPPETPAGERVGAGCGGSRQQIFTVSDRYDTLGACQPAHKSKPGRQHQNSRWMDGWMRHRRGRD